MISRYEYFTGMISNIHRQIQKIEHDEMIKHGYKGAYAQYLAALNRSSEGLTSVQICDLCDRDKAAVSRSIAEMEAKGLVYRDNDHENRYRAKLKLTERGKETADLVCRKAYAAVMAGGSGLTDEKRAIFYEVLELISANLQYVSETGIPE